MKKAIDYAVEQMKKEGFVVCPVTTRRVIRHVIDYVANELNETHRAEIPGLGVFTKEVKEPQLMYSHLIKREVMTRPRVIIRFKPGKHFRPKIQEQKES